MNIDTVDRFIVKTSIMIDLGFSDKEIRDEISQFGVNDTLVKCIYLAAKTLSDSRQDKNI